MTELRLYPAKKTDVKHVEKRWGYEKWFHNAEYCMKELLFGNGQQCSLHYHVVKDEILTCVQGGGEILVGAQGDLSPDQQFIAIRMDPGDVVHMPRQTLHRIIAGPLGMIIFEASTHHEDDDSIRVLE